MAETTPGQWISTVAGDIEPHDLIKYLGDLMVVSDRDRTPGTDAHFHVTLPNGEKVRIGKLSRVLIWDARGDVAERLKAAATTARR